MTPTRNAHTEDTRTPRKTELRIFQQNLNKSSIAQDALINREPHRLYNFLFIQEPYINPNTGFTRASAKFNVVYPHGHKHNPKRQHDQ